MSYRACYKTRHYEGLMTGLTDDPVEFLLAEISAWYTE